MKLASIPLFAAAAATVNADLKLAPIEGPLEHNTFYTVEWTSDEPCWLDLYFVKRAKHVQWDTQEIITIGQVERGSGSWTFGVSPDIDTEGEYAFFMYGDYDSVLTPWFTIEEASEDRERLVRQGTR